MVPEKAIAVYALDHLPVDTNTVVLRDVRSPFVPMAKLSIFVRIPTIDCTLRKHLVYLFYTVFERAGGCPWISAHIS